MNCGLLSSQGLTKLLSASILCYSVVATLSAQTSVLTQHNDIARTGQNLTETILTPANVTTSGFGKLFTLNVDGQVIAQPLYMPSVSIGGTSHRVVFVVTEHDSVYAFDASSGTQLWKATVLDAAHGAASGATPEPESDNGCGDITALGGAAAEYGITGTPVIDPSTGTIYLVATTFEGTYPVQRLHALDITTGNEKFNGPVTISASTAGTGSGSSGGTLSFDPRWENQRAGLLLLNGNVYAGFGSHCDSSSWHGWILGYNAATLAQTAKFVSTPNGASSGVWMAGGGLAADIESSIARIFPVTGNGSYDATTPYGTNNMDYGDDILRLTVSSTGALTVADAFTPFNQSSLSASDTDVGSGGALLLPDQPGSNPHLLVQLGKSGAVYLVNRENLGGNNASTNNIVQQVTASNGLWGLPAYWNGNVYLWPAQGKLSRYPLTNGLLSTSPSEVSAESESAWYGSTPAISANGTQAGIVWAVDWSQSPQVLYAHDATNVSKLLWSSAQNSARDSAGAQQKFAVPTIADGNVFVGAVNQVMVYGELAPPAPNFSLSASPTVLSVVTGSTVTSQITVTPVNGFTGSPTFTATDLPSGVTASFSPSSATGATLTLTAAASAPVTSAPVTVTITGTSSTLSHSVALTLSVTNVSAPTEVSMSSAFNVYGIFTDGTTVTNGGLDADGNAYSANLLGSSVTGLGVPFTFGPVGASDAAANTTVPLPAGNFSELDILGAAVNGNQANQTFIVNYTDGTTSAFTQSLSDWFTPQSYAGETTVSNMAHRVTASGATQAGPFYLYGYSFTVNNAKTVASITLPANRNVTVLAMTLSGTAVSKSAQTITFGSIATQTVGVPLTLSASASSGLTVTLASTTTNVCTVSGNTATFLTAGTCSIVASQAGNATYLAATPVTQSFTVNAATLTPQTITFGAISAQTVGKPLTLSATASSGLAVSFASTTAGVCMVSGTTATFTSTGTCSIVASQSGNATYAAATPVMQSFTVNAAALTPQTITFGTIAQQAVGKPLTLAATASSGLAVAFVSTTASVCTVSGNTATFIAAGTCSIVASQAGNATYAAATPVTQSFAVVSSVCTPTQITPYIQVDGAAWQQISSVTVAPGSTVNLGPQPLGGTWSWTGPNGFTSTQREIDGIPLSTGANTFVATYTNATSCKTNETFVVTVAQAADFSLALSSSSLTLARSFFGPERGSDTVTISALHGFSGSVALSITGLPSGWTASFSPTSIATSGNSTLAIATGFFASRGTYTMTVKATSGSISHTATLTVIVP